jgi:hypothetical protein
MKSRIAIAQTHTRKKRQMIQNRARGRGMTRGALLRVRVAREAACIEEPGSQLLATEALKGHGFRRAARCSNRIAALASEGKRVIEIELPQGLKPGFASCHPVAQLKPCPFKTQLR